MIGRGGREARGHAAHAATSTRNDTSSWLLAAKASARGCQLGSPRKIPDSAAEHAGAGSRGRHDIIDSRKRLDHLFGDPARRRPVAGIEGGLATAGLRRNLDTAARILKELHRREGDRRPDQVDKAGDEQSDAAFRRALSPKFGVFPAPGSSHCSSAGCGRRGLALAGRFNGSAVACKRYAGSLLRPAKNPQRTSARRLQALGTKIGNEILIRYAASEPI